MILEVFAVYDTKARVYSNPFVLGHVDLACRAFAEAANNPNNNIGKYPEDHILYHIGRFDDVTAGFESIQPPLNLGKALLYKKGNPPSA